MMRRKTGMLLLTSAAAIAMLSACDSDKKETREEMALRLQAELESTEDVSTGSIFTDLTPELVGVTSRPSDSKRIISENFNLSMRMFWDDWGRVLLLDRPSRLTPHPTPY